MNEISNNECEVQLCIKKQVFKSFLTRVVLCVVTVFLSACVTFPYVEEPRPVYNKNNLDDALSYVDHTYDAYRYKLLQDVRQSSELSSGLMALGAIGIGLAAFDAHLDTLKATGLLGASAYQLGTWNRNDDRRKSYLAGMRAMVCINEVVNPMLGIAGNQTIIQRDIAQLNEAFDEYANEAGKVTEALSNMSLVTIEFSNVTDNAKRQLALIEQDREIVSQLVSKASALQSKSVTLAPRIITQVDRIRFAIDSEITPTIASTDELGKHISALNDYAQFFTPGLDFSQMLTDKLSETSDKAETQIDDAMKAQSGASGPKAEAAKDKLTFATTALNALSEAMGSMQAKRLKMLMRAKSVDGLLTLPLDLSENTFKSCGIDKQDIATPLRIDQTTIEFTEGIIETALLEVSGGTKPYYANPTKTPQSALTIASIAGGAGIVINSTDSAKSGSSFQVKVKDSASQFKMLTVNIVKGEEPENDAVQSDQVTQTQCSATNTQVWNEQFSKNGYLFSGTISSGLVLIKPTLFGNTVSGEIVRIGDFALQSDFSDETKIKQSLLIKLKEDPVLQSYGCKEWNANESLSIHTSLANALSPTPVTCDAKDIDGKLKCALRYPIDSATCGEDFTLSFGEYKDGALTVALKPISSICTGLKLESLATLVEMVRSTLIKSIETFSWQEDIKLQSLTFSNQAEIQARIVEVTQEAAR